MIDIKVGKSYTTESGYTIRCVSRFALAKGTGALEGKFKEEPKYGFTFIVNDGPTKNHKGNQVRYYHNNLPISNKIPTGKITGEV